MNTRCIAVKIVTELQEKQCSLSQILPEYKNLLKKPADQSLVQALCFGVCRWYPRLEFFVNQLLSKPLKAKDRDIFNLLCIGIFQLSWMRIPDHAAISETVEAAKGLNKIWAKGLVNAILRNYQRKIDQLNQALSLKQNKVAFTAHPLWLLDNIQKAWKDDWENIITANNQQAPLILRVNLQKISREAYLTLLSNQNILAKALSHIPTAIILNEALDVTNLPGFNEGLFSVQDGSGQMTAQLLDLKPSLRVLDACSAPGGKLAHILEAEPTTSLMALDISENRTHRIKENLQRLDLLKQDVVIQTFDANDVDAWWDKKPFDRILCDAPCSATGIIRRHPDIKLVRHREDIPRLQAQQLNLLNNLWPLLKPGGLLLYSTCSILPEENNDVIQQFLNQHDDATISKISTIELPYGHPIEGGNLGHQFLPGENNTDGFYYARLKKGA